MHISLQKVFWYYDQFYNMNEDAFISGNKFQIIRTIN